MIRHIHHSLRWFGAVAVLLLLPVAVQADDIEPEPYVEEDLEPEPEVEAEEEAITEPPPAPATASTGPGIGSKIFDCVVLRPFDFATTIVGGALFVPAAALTSGVLFVPATVLLEHRDRARAVEGIKTAWEHFVVAPAENTFKRPLGEF